MGGAYSMTDSIQTLFTMLKKERVPRTNAIWNSITFSSFYFFDPSKTLQPDLQLIKQRSSDNLNDLIQFSVEAFTKLASLDYRELNKYSSSFCFFLSELARASGPIYSNSAWAQASKVYLTANTPAASMSETIGTLLFVSSQPSVFLSTGAFTYKCNYMRMLISFQKAFPFSENADLPFFDSLMPLMPLTFESIPIVINSYTTEDSLTFLKYMIIYTSRLLYYSKSYQRSFAGMNPIPVQKAFSLIYQLMNPQMFKRSRDRLNKVLPHIVCLIFVVFKQMPQFLRFLEINRMTKFYVAAFLHIFQSTLETDDRTFIRIVLVYLTHYISSNSYEALISLNDPFDLSFTTKTRPHKGTYADLIIEVFTNAFSSGFLDNIALAPMIFSIICNLSSTVVSISCHSVSRLFSFLKDIFTHKVLEVPEYECVLEYLLTTIYQLIRLHPMNNIPILLYSIEESRLWSALEKSQNKYISKTSRKLISILTEVAKYAKEAQKLAPSAEFQSQMSLILSPYNTPPLDIIKASVTPEAETSLMEYFDTLIPLSAPPSVTPSVPPAPTPTVTEEEEEESVVSEVAGEVMKDTGDDLFGEDKDLEDFLNGE